jgi:hypothetical protein
MMTRTKWILFRKYFSLSIFLLALSTVLGCASGNLRVTSTPEKAEVFVAYEGEQPQKIGDTPLNLDSRLLENRRGKFVSLQVRKEGFQPETVLIPKLLMKSTIDVSTRLDEQRLPLQCQDMTVAIEKIARGIANVQTYINTNKVLDAQSSLTQLISEFPNISVLYDLMGNVHYINKNLEEALRSYEKSLRLNPGNTDTLRIAQKIRGIVGVRVPSSGGQ